MKYQIKYVKSKIFYIHNHIKWNYIELVIVDFVTLVELSCTFPCTLALSPG